MAIGSMRGGAVALLTGLALLASSGASARTTPLTAATLAALKDQAIVLSVHKKPTFVSRTADKAAFAALGAGAMMTEGDRIVAENDVDDPAVMLGHELLGSLVADGGAVAAPDATTLVDGDDPARLAAAYPDSPYVLDARTYIWSLGYYPLAWSHYRVHYAVRVKLVDTRGKRVLAEGSCDRYDSDESHAPTMEELLANRAERLKAMLHVHASACLDELRRTVLAEQH